MALIQKIPLLADTTDQRLTVELGGNPYILRVLWNERFEYFSLSVHTAADEPLLTNVKMVRDHPLIGRFKDTRLPFGDLYLVRGKGSADRPGYADLGGSCNLFYYEPDPSPAAGSTVWDQ